MYTQLERRRRLAEKLECCFTNLTLYHSSDLSRDKIAKLLKNAGCEVEFEDEEDTWGHRPQPDQP